MEYNEEDIINKLKDWQPKVNTEEIWNSVKNKAPIVRRKRNKFIIPFFLGLCMGVVGLYLLPMERNATLICSSSQKVNLLKKQLALAYTELNAVKIELEKNRLADIQNKKVPDFAKRYNSSEAVASETSTNGSIEIPEDDQVIFKTQACNEQTLTVEQEASNWQENTNKSLNQIDEGMDTSNAVIGLLVMPTVSDLHSLDKLVMPDINTKTKGIAMLRNVYFDAGYGCAYNLGSNAINISGQFEGKRKLANVQYLSWTMSRKINTYFSANLSIQLLRLNKGFDYKFERKEVIEIIDTSQLVIDPSGNVIPVIGNHTAIKLTQKTGSFYLTEYKLGIVPGISVEYNLTRNWKMVHGLGFGFDILRLDEAPPAFLTDAALWQHSGSGLMMSPVFKMSHRIDHQISANRNASFVLSFMIRKEKLTTLEKERIYKFILPTIGLGLSI